MKVRHSGLFFLSVIKLENAANEMFFIWYAVLLNIEQCIKDCVLINLYGLVSLFAHIDGIIFKN